MHSLLLACRYNLTKFNARQIMHYVIGVLKVFQKKGCVNYHEVGGICLFVMIA